MKRLGVRILLILTCWVVLVFAMIDYLFGDSDPLKNWTDHWKQLWKQAGTW